MISEFDTNTLDKFREREGDESEIRVVLEKMTSWLRHPVTG